MIREGKDVTVRVMLPEEADEVKRIGRRAFIGLESLFVGKPRDAVVAVCDGEIAGALTFNYFQYKGNKTAYADFAYISREYRNIGIGGLLYGYAFRYIWEEKGCDNITALVKDDNVGSWKPLLNNGFARASVGECIGRFGVGWLLNHLLRTPFGIASGMDLYVACRDSRLSDKKGGNKQLTLYFLVNMLIVMTGMLYGANKGASMLFAFAILMVLRTATAYIGTLFGGHGWSFRLCNGGIIISAGIRLINGLYPMIGNWYPDQYSKDEGFHRDMGLTGLLPWIATIIIALISAAMTPAHMLFKYVLQVSQVFLFYQMIPLYPFEGFGGGRVLRWSKAVFGVMFLLTIITMWVCDKIAP